MVEFKLPRGNLERERFAVLVDRIAALEERVSALEGGKEDAPDFAAHDTRKELVARAVELGLGEESAIKRWPTDKVVAAIQKAGA